MLSITADFSPEDLGKIIKADFDSIIYEMGKGLFKTGCKAVDLARAKTKSDGGFGNITWNLRGSIGCVLLMNHKISDEFIYFPPIGKGDEGRQKGIDYAREIALLVDDGDPVLIIVAGMEYASLVQATVGDVIGGSTLKIGSLLKEVLNS